MSLQTTTNNSPNSERLLNVQRALEALRNVMVNNPGVEFQCIGHFKLIFSLLGLRDCGKLQQFTVEVINCVAVNQECVNDIAASSILAYLLLALHTLPQCQLLILESLFALMSNTKIVKEALHKGAAIYLLDLFCNATDPNVRQQTAELFAKMLSDKLIGPKVRILLNKFLPPVFMDAMRDSAEASVHMFEEPTPTIVQQTAELFAKMLSDKLIGPKVRILLNKFLPPVFMDAMRDSAEASVHMFEGTQENPELIWNDESREKVASTVQDLKNDHYNRQKDNPDVKWTLPDDFNLEFMDVAGELVVGGVFLRLFIANPGWVLRKPREFLTELLETWTQLAATDKPNGETLETVTTAVVSLFQANSPLLDQVPSLGYIPRVFTAMTHKNDAIPKSAIQIAQQLAQNELCIRSMAQIECIPPFKAAMKLRRDMMTLAADALSKIFAAGYDDLVQQALQCELIDFLLKILEGGCEAVDNPAATKAQIAQVLKAMERSLEYGDQVTRLLDQSPVWAQYRDQLHGLFITESAIAGYLTGPTGPAVAGYLTAGTPRSSSMSDKPPPVDHGIHTE